MLDIVYLNGQFVERKDALISIEDRGFQFGDGVYEVTKFFGRRALRLDEHLARLEKSASDLRIYGAPTAAEWRLTIDKLLDLYEITEDDTSVRGLYQQVTRGTVTRNHAFPAQSVEPTSVACFNPVKLYPQEFRIKGIELSTQPDERWDRCYIKSICLLPVVLAKQAALEAGAFEALLVRDGMVTEGGSTNIFGVIDGVVYTHPEGPYILSGITRNLVFEAAARAGVKVVERPMSLEDFQGADEAFVSSTTLDIMPAVLVDSKAIGKGSTGPVTTKLAETLQVLVREETGIVLRA